MIWPRAEPVKVSREIRHRARCGFGPEYTDPDTRGLTCKSDHPLSWCLESRFSANKSNCTHINRICKTASSRAVLVCTGLYIMSLSVGNKQVMVTSPCRVCSCQIGTSSGRMQKPRWQGQPEAAAWRAEDKAGGDAGSESLSWQPWPEVTVPPVTPVPNGVTEVSDQSRQDLGIGGITVG